MLPLVFQTSFSQKENDGCGMAELEHTGLVLCYRGSLSQQRTPLPLFDLILLLQD